MFGKTVIAVFASLAAIASAYTTPVGDPTGNPIAKPGLNELVPVGRPYTITWDPTTTGTVTILLLRGPSTNVVPIGAPIAVSVQNTGTFVWNVPTALEPDTTHYGMQLIVDATGQYQYSTQFGISNPDYTGSSSSASSVAASTSMSSATSSPCSTTTTAIKTPVANSTMITVTSMISSKIVASTGFPVSNSSFILPTKSMTVPSSLIATATGATSATASAPVSTGAAGHVQAALGLIGAVAGLVMVL